MTTLHFVLESCNGEYCGMCRREGNPDTPATHKVGEEIDIVGYIGHNLTQYVCCRHFVSIVGSAAHQFRGCPFPTK